MELIDRVTMVRFGLDGWRFCELLGSRLASRRDHQHERRVKRAATLQLLVAGELLGVMRRNAKVVRLAKRLDLATAKDTLVKLKSIKHGALSALTAFFNLESLEGVDAAKLAHDLGGQSNPELLKLSFKGFLRFLHDLVDLAESVDCLVDGVHFRPLANPGLRALAVEVLRFADHKVWDGLGEAISVAFNTADMARTAGQLRSYLDRTKADDDFYVKPENLRFTVVPKVASRG